MALTKINLGNMVTGTLPDANIPNDITIDVSSAVPASGLTGNTLASGVTASSLTSVGTLGNTDFLSNSVQIRAGQVLVSESGGSQSYLYSGGSFTALRTTSSHPLHLSANYSSGDDSLVIGTDKSATFAGSVNIDLSSDMSGKTWYTSSNTRPLQIRNTSLVAYNDNQTYLSTGAYFDTGGHWKPIKDGNAMLYHQQDDGRHYWYTDPVTGTGNITWTERMKLDGSNLTVAGTLKTGGTVTIEPSSGNSQLFFHSPSSDWYITNVNSASTLNFYNGSTDVLVLGASTATFAGLVDIDRGSGNVDVLRLQSSGDFRFAFENISGSGEDLVGYFGSSLTRNVSFKNTGSGSVNLNVAGEIRLGTGGSGTKLVAEDLSNNRRLYLYGSSSNSLAIGPYDDNGWVYFLSNGCNNGAYFNNPVHYFDVGDVRPYDDNELNLGASDKRWVNIYLINNPTVTSDERKKDNIKTSSLGLEFLNKLNPVQYKWKDYEKFKKASPESEKEFTDEKIKHTYKRTHYGLIAQEVEKVLTDSGMTTDDFAPLVYDKESDSYAMRYGEYVGILIKSIQELSDKLDTANAKITALENA